MAKTVGDYLIQRLSQWGVRRIYGFPGDGILGILGALNRAGHEMEFIQTRHEEMAAFMACAHAKFTGEVGVCLATSGPGAIHLLNGLYDAKMDHMPVLAIVGQADRSAMGGEYQQEVDLVSLFKDVASEFIQVAMAPAQVRHLVDRALRIAKSERVVTCLVIPKDLQEDDAVEEPPRAHGTVHSSTSFSVPRVLPNDEDLRRAAEILNAGERVAMLVGAGALTAQEEVKKTAEVLQAGVAKALLGKACLPDALPYVTGAIGLLGTKPSWDMMNECDTLLTVGSNFPYSEFLPKEGAARGVQIDLDPRRLGIRYPYELNLVGDAKETLQALLPLLRHKPRGRWRETIERRIEDWWKVNEDRARTPATPLNPQWVFWCLSPKLPDGAIISSDSGTSANWYGRDLKFRDGMMGSLSGNLATMGCGMPYAIAAKFAYPDRHVFALVGDGAMQMNGNSALVTVKKYWEGWRDKRFTVLVLNNRDLNQVTWEMRAMSGDPRYPSSQGLPDFPYAKYAELLGLKGIRVERPEDVPSVWDEAIAADRPCVVEAYVDPEVPTLPPHISLKEAQAFASSVVRGDERTGGMIRQALENMFPGLTRKTKEEDK
jgi:pyruvate dehydrogenase (quinone)